MMADGRWSGVLEAASGNPIVAIWARSLGQRCFRASDIFQRDRGLSNESDVLEYAFSVKCVTGFILTR